MPTLKAPPKVDQPSACSSRARMQAQVLAVDFAQSLTSFNVNKIALGKRIIHIASKVIARAAT